LFLKKAQWVVIFTGFSLTIILFLFGRTSPYKQAVKAGQAPLTQSELTNDSILFHAKEMLTPEQATRITLLEQSVTRGDVQKQKIEILHQLAHFWKDSTRLFEPYALYEAESARLENSEKSLTFAAHLILENLRSEQNERLKKWKAVQAKDLFERSLKLNDKNDSTIVGLGACYIFGNIAENPMEGILKVRQVAERDSTNVFAQMVLGHGSFLSEQYDKAIDRFGKVITLQPGNLEAILMMAEVFERKADKSSAAKWYSLALERTSNAELKKALEKRIEELK
jgi:tetratricopeptide (TPR) repeat protein